MSNVFFIKLENRFTGSSEMGNGKETRQEVLVTILRVWVAEYEYANVVQNRAVLLGGQSRVKISKGMGYWGDSDDVNLKSCIDSQCSYFQLGNHENEVSYKLVGRYIYEQSTEVIHRDRSKVCGIEC